jgi:hypothetical protein
MITLGRRTDGLAASVIPAVQAESLRGSFPAVVGGLPGTVPTPSIRRPGMPLVSDFQQQTTRSLKF